MTPPPAPRPPLTQLDRDVLAFEARGWPRTARQTHTHAAADLFEVTETRYWQILNAAITHPDAARLHPALVTRYARLRTQRASPFLPVVDPRQRPRQLRTTT